MSVVDLQSLADEAAIKAGIPPELYRSLIASESSWNPSAYNASSGAYGLAQIIPKTAIGLGINVYNVIDNLTGGAQVLKEMYDKFGNWTQAIAGYKGYSNVNSTAAQSAANEVIAGIPSPILSKEAGNPTGYSSTAATAKSDIWTKTLPIVDISIGDIVLVLIVLFLIFASTQGLIKT